MKDLAGYYFDLNFVPSFIDLLYVELENLVVEDNFYSSPYNQIRADVSRNLKHKVVELFPFPISDLGFFKNDPMTSYPWHKDAERKFAVNILLCDPNANFQIYFYNFEDRRKIEVPYRKNIPLVFNTSKMHSITNNHQTATRYIFTIGSTEMSYDIGLGLLRDKFFSTWHKNK